MKLFSAIVQQIKYHMLLVLIWLIRYLPYSFVLNFFRSLGVIAWLVDPFHRKIASIQMQAALGLKHVWYIVLKVFINQGEILVDAIRYAYMSDAEINARVEVEGKEHLDEALASKRGIMIFMGHIGNWEILSNVPRLFGIQLCHMAELRKDPQLESIIHEIRSRSGITFLPPKGKALMLIRELKKGRIISMMVDLRTKGKRALLCNFFGLPAITNPGPAFIALKGNALVLPLYTVKLNGTHRICFEKAMDPGYFGEGYDAIQALSDFMQSWVASIVRKHPEQWIWLYTRWLKRSDIRRIIKKKLDFKEYIHRQVEAVMSDQKK